jgi:hypothetical protein
VPKGWMVRETAFYVAHYTRVSLTVNSQRPELEIRDWPVGGNSRRWLWQRGPAPPDPERGSQGLDCFKNVRANWRADSQHTPFWGWGVREMGSPESR